MMWCCACVDVVAFHCEVVMVTGCERACDKRASDGASGEFGSVV